MSGAERRGGEDGPESAAVREQLELAFAPIHKGAFGIALGTTAALLVMLLTVFHVFAEPGIGYLRLLSNYFYGYSITWGGVFVGGFWAFVAGFVMGWFVAFCRNLVIAASVFITRTRSELGQTRDFLDHI